MNGGTKMALPIFTHGMVVHLRQAFLMATGTKKALGSTPSKEEEIHRCQTMPPFGIKLTSVQLNRLMSITIDYQ